MNEKTKRFVRSKFEEYYRRAKIETPEDTWMREWGFVLFDQYFPAKLVMRRHKSFATEGELVNYLRENAPAHAYHSAAIYKYPAAEMANKGWLGADLIFDLDADHVISEAELQRYSYEGLLELVKKETVKLIDFLLNDFGFHEEDIELVFSGSRGYHLHIKTEEVRGLGSRERREIVDYVMATGLDMDRIFVKGKKRTINGYVGKESTLLKPIGSWGKRLYRETIDFFQKISEVEEKKAMEEIKKIKGIGDKKAEEIIRIAKDEKQMEGIKRGILSPDIPMLEKIRDHLKAKIKDTPDEPVTSDIKRLIRLPTSLHGKSSLEVKPVRIEAFRDFDPLEDAIAFGDSPVEISATRDSSVKMKGEKYEVEEGEIASVPEHAALYFMCRGAAEIKERNK